jgi:hypothetical protein
MRNGLMTTFLVSAVTIALSACAPSQRVAEGYGLLTFVCDTSLKRPPRPAEIPAVPPIANYGSITGTVVRAGTDVGIDSASITLVPEESASGQSSRSRLTGQTGGFAFDSIVPGRYLLRVLAAWEHPQSVVAVVLPGRIDTVRILMAAPGFCARS